MLCAEVCKSVLDYRRTLNQSSSTIQKHLQQIGEQNRVGVCHPHSLAKEHKANHSITCNFLLQWHNVEVFFNRLTTRDEEWVLYKNPKGSGSLRMNQVYTLKSRFCVFGGVFARSLILKWWNVAFTRSSKSIFNWKCPAVSKRKLVILQSGMKNWAAQGKPWKKLISGDGRYWLVHYTCLTVHLGFSFTPMATTFSVWQKIWKFGWCPKCHHQIFCSKTNWFLSIHHWKFAR